MKLTERYLVKIKPLFNEFNDSRKEEYSSKDFKELLSLKRILSKTSFYLLEMPYPLMEGEYSFKNFKMREGYFGGGLLFGNLDLTKEILENSKAINFSSPNGLYSKIFGQVSLKKRFLRKPKLLFSLGGFEKRPERESFNYFEDIESFLEEAPLEFDPFYNNFSKNIL